MNKPVDISDVVLKTKRLVLRAFKEDDLEDLYEYAKVEGVGEAAGWPHHTSILESKEVLDMFIKEKNNFAIIFNDKVIGSIGVNEYDENEASELGNLMGREIGYVLSIDYWGQGFMSEAVNEVIRYLFMDLNLDFILCSHALTNDRSRRVQEKNNFKFYKNFIYKTRFNTTRESKLNILFKEDYLKTQV